MKSIPSLVLDDGPEVSILELKRYKQEMGPLLYNGLRFLLKEHPLTLMNLLFQKKFPQALDYYR